MRPTEGKKRTAEADGKPKWKKGSASASNQTAKSVEKRARSRQTELQGVNRKRNGGQPDQGKEIPWITVGKKKVVRKLRWLSDALGFKTEAGTYTEMLRAMRDENRFLPLGADVQSIRRTRTGEMMLVLKKGVVKKGISYKALAQEVLEKCR